MAESAKEIDLDPRKYVGLSFPLKGDNNNDFALTKTSTEQAGHNLKNLLLTESGERLAQPAFGSQLKALCFEPNNSDLPVKLEEEIRRAVGQWLPYINIQEVNVLTDAVDVNQVFVSILFSTILNAETLQSITLNAGSSTTAY